MKQTPDLNVCNPAVGINDRSRSAVFIKFDLVDSDGERNLGAGHLITMSAADAMRLLGLLRSVQETFGLPDAASKPELFKLPRRSERH